MFGIDISHHNSENPYLKRLIAASSVIFIKATEGSTWTDPCISSYLKEIELAFKPVVGGFIRRLPFVGFYHYLTTTSDVEKQARHFYTTIKKHMPCFVALDIEGDAERALNISHLADRFIETFRKCVEDDGRVYSGNFFIYTNTSASKRSAFSALSKYPWWIADYSDMLHPRTDKKWVIRQFSSDSLGIDLNFINLTMEEFSLYGVGFPLDCDKENEKKNELDYSE